MNNNIKISYPSSEKIYLKGSLYPELRVAMRRVRLTPTVTIENGKRKLDTNAPVYIYDTSGPYSDPNIDIDLDKMEEIAFGATKLRVIKTPGHAPGHVSLYNEEQKVLFTGDTLFRESIGRTDLPGGDYSWIMTSILEQLVPLGDDVEFYPGHGDKSTIGHETLYNPFVTEVLNNEINYKG